MSMYSFDTLMLGRLEQFKTQQELARNFYDDRDFCPLRSAEDEVAHHRERIQQRISPQSSPSASPPAGYASPHKLHTRAIPIIDPTNMTPVPVPQHAPPAHLNHWFAFSNAHHVMTPSGIPIVDPSTGQALSYQHPLPHGLYDVSVR